MLLFFHYNWTILGQRRKPLIRNNQLIHKLSHASVFLPICHFVKIVSVFRWCIELGDIGDFDMLLVFRFIWPELYFTFSTIKIQIFFQYILVWLCIDASTIGPSKTVAVWEMWALFFYYFNLVGFFTRCHCFVCVGLCHHRSTGRRFSHSPKNLLSIRIELQTLHKIHLM